MNTPSFPANKLPACYIVNPGTIITTQHIEELAEFSLGRPYAESLGALGVCGFCEIDDGQEPTVLWPVEGEAFMLPKGCKFDKIAHCITLRQKLAELLNRDNLKKEN